MTFIKKFESMSIDSSIEYCKDVIETLPDFEDEVHVSGYTQGYTRYDYPNAYISRDPSNESDKKCIQFYLKLKTDYADDSKETFDKLISLLQKSKFLFSKLNNYCSDVKFEVDNKSIGFILLFDNEDESLKRTAKIKRIYKSINEALTDFNRYKRIFLSITDKSEDYKKEIYSLLRDQNPNKNYFTLRYSINISMEDGVISMKPNQFRYDYNSKLKGIKYSKKLASLIVKHLHNLLTQGYIYGLKDDAEFEETDDSLKVKIK